MKHVNIPIFIPHLGCPNQCIFCNQRYISGTINFDESSVDKTIEEVLSTVNDEDECEIAFFGGSFTGIDKDLMVRLLNKAQGYVDKGKIIGIRMSTRPDYINEEIISILKNYTVTFVELGIQSMNDNVLSYLKRGHTSNDTVKAAKLLNNASIKFVGQMMVGLPNATIEDEIYTAKAICDLGASGSRIYPTLVFKNTELEVITASGQYSPLSIEEAVERTASLLNVFVKHRVPCIRIGLCESDNLHSDDTYLAGPNSPSIGEMVKSRVYRDVIINKLESLKRLSTQALIIECPSGATSQVVGNKRQNIIEIKNRYGLKDIKVKENADLMQYQIKIKEKEE